MKHLYEYKKYALLPKDLRQMNLLYHSTWLEYFEKILKDDELYGTDMYDSGVSNSRNKHYAFGMNDDEFGHNVGEIQLILDRDKIKQNYKINAFDWEEYKRTDNKTGEYSNYHQPEDKIITDKIKNIHKYIIGLHIVKNDILLDIIENKLILNKIKEYNWLVFDEDWNNINNSVLKMSKNQ
ncbi:hypothetical protein M0Q50_04830 [bacterium]|jgi:hypothetical protein|nr:hypothetical protein [bacterium]